MNDNVIELHEHEMVHAREEPGCLNCRGPVDIADCEWVAGYVHKGHCHAKFEQRRIALPWLERTQNLACMAALAAFAVIYVIAPSVRWIFSVGP